MSQNKIFSLILVLFLIVPTVAGATDPLCSDGTPAPAGNICNCGASGSLSSNFTPGSGSGLSSNTYGGFSFNGAGGAIMSCINAGKLLQSASNSLFGSKGGGSAGGTSTASGTGEHSGNTAAENDHSKGSADKGGASTGTAVPTTDSDVSTNTSSTASNTAAAQAELEKTTQREQCLNGAADAVAKIALQKLSDKTINWIKTGFNGNPFYVRDIDSYLKSVENEKLDSYLNNHIATSDPIFGNSLRSIMKLQVTGYSDGLLNKAMNTPQAKAYQDFQDDFTQGGWSALLNPNYNPVGAYFSAADELNGIIGGAEQNIQNELQQGNGFLSQRKCVQYEVAAPAAPVRTVGVGADTCGVKDSQGNCLGSPSSGSTSTTTQTSGSTTPKCLRYEVVTPGSVISQQISYISNSAARQLENTNKINQVLGLYFDQLMNNWFSAGLSGSGRGSSTATTGGGMGTNVVTGTNGQTLASPISCQTPLGYDSTTGGFNQDFDISRPQQLRAVIVAQKDYITRSQDAQFVMQKIVPVLGALDYCMPGPNPSWASNLNENGQVFINSLTPIIKTQKPAGILVALNKVLDPINALGFKSYLNPRESIAGFTITRMILSDKVDGGSVRVSDRGYPTDNVALEDIQGFFSDVFDMMKSRYAGFYSDNNIMNAFLATATTPTDIINTKAFVKDSIKETGNLLGYSQGIDQYNQEYTTSIDDAQVALAELEDIDQQVERIVAKAKADYILKMQTAGTPVKVSCLDNAYQIGTVGAGVLHNENITAPVDQMTQHSRDSWTYFYNNL